jgi:hypothetical protein
MRFSEAFSPARKPTRTENGKINDAQAKRKMVYMRIQDGNRYTGLEAPEAECPMLNVQFPMFREDP